MRIAHVNTTQTGDRIMSDISQVKRNIELLHDDDFTELLRWMSQEHPIRRDRQAQERGQVAVVEQLREQGVIEPPTGGDNPQEWENPGTTHTKMYLLGDVITHNGKTYRSTHPGLNHWEPGAPSIDYRIWEEVVWEEEADDGVIQFRAGVAVVTGDIVRYGGELYQVLQAHTLADHWPPPEVASLYSKV